MSRVLRLASAAAVVVLMSGLTAAQSPTTPSLILAQSPVTSSPFSVQAPGTTMPAPAVTSAGQAMPVGRSTWRSQDGSVVDITIDQATGALTGTFAPGFPCGQATTPTTPPRPIAGVVSGNAVAWTLSLPACPSVGTWVGHYQALEAGEQLAMLWTLAVQESPPGVGSTLTGSALFVRQAVQ